MSAGAPLVRLVDRGLEREILAAGRAIDSLTVSESAARSAGRAGDASRLTAERTSAVAALEALERRIASYCAAFDGGVLPPSVILSVVVQQQSSLPALAALDSVELRGATRRRRDSRSSDRWFMRSRAPTRPNRGRDGDGCLRRRVETALVVGSKLECDARRATPGDLEPPAKRASSSVGRTCSARSGGRRDSSCAPICGCRLSKGELGSAPNSPSIGD